MPGAPGGQHGLPPRRLAKRCGSDPGQGIQAFLQAQLDLDQPGPVPRHQHEGILAKAQSDGEIDADRDQPVALEDGVQKADDRRHLTHSLLFAFTGMLRRRISYIAPMRKGDVPSLSGSYRRA